MGKSAENRRGRGRPGRLTAELADAIVAQLVAGASLDKAARACGLGPRTLRAWRACAWSHRTADAPFVNLEKRILQALATAKAAESPPWEQAAAMLESEYPERWGPPEARLDHLLARLDEAWPG